MGEQFFSFLPTNVLVTFSGVMFAGVLLMAIAFVWAFAPIPQSEGWQRAVTIELRRSAPIAGMIGFVIILLAFTALVTVVGFPVTLTKEQIWQLIGGFVLLSIGGSTARRLYKISNDLHVRMRVRPNKLASGAAFFVAIYGILFGLYLIIRAAL